MGMAEAVSTFPTLVSGTDMDTFRADSSWSHTANTQRTDEKNGAISAIYGPARVNVGA